MDAFLTATKPFPGPYVHRTLPGLARVLRSLDVDLNRLPFPTLTVVGSKGKGTTTAAASAALHQAGLTVGTVTSPSLVEVRERVRIAGVPLDYDTYVEWGQQLRAAMAAHERTHPDEPLPYLGGRAFMLGMVAFARLGVDVAVVEASMGGRIDPVSLLPSTVVALTQVFGEHLGILGATIPDIAVEKLGATAPATTHLVTLTQRPDVTPVVNRHVAVTGLRLTTVNADTRYGHHPNRFMDRNLELGRRAAQTWLHARTGDPGATAVLPTMHVPGRGQLVGAAGMVDSAVTASAIGEALDVYDQLVGGRPDVVFASVGKRREDAETVQLLAAAGVRTVGVSLPADKYPLLALDETKWPHVVPMAALTPQLMGERWLMVGTTTPTAHVLRIFGVDTSRLW